MPEMSDTNTDTNKGHKVCAKIHAALTLVLIYGLVSKGTVNELAQFGICILLCAAAAVGCWNRWRWLVALAGLPLMFVSLVGFVAADIFHMGSGDLQFFLVLAGLVWLLEIASFMYAKKDRIESDPYDQGNIFRL